MGAVCYDLIDVGIDYAVGVVLQHFKIAHDAIKAVRSHLGLT
jgi:hypothetical protein